MSNAYESLENRHKMFEIRVRLEKAKYYIHRYSMKISDFHDYFLTDFHNK